MPVRRKTRKRSRRGGSLRAWARKAHNYVKSKNGYSRGLSAAYNKYGKNVVNKKFGKYSGVVDKGVAMALGKLKQAGYGKCGSGLRRTGHGLRLAGGSRLKY